jgi:hypothetical protein
MGISERIDHWQAQELESQHVFDRRELLVWTVYDHPLDFPDHFIACANGTAPLRPLGVHLQADSLDELRRLLPQQLARSSRAPGDDPFIVETWL